MRDSGLVVTREADETTKVGPIIRRRITGVMKRQSNGTWTPKECRRWRGTPQERFARSMFSKVHRGKGLPRMSDDDFGKVLAEEVQVMVVSGDLVFKDDGTCVLNRSLYKKQQKKQRCKKKKAQRRQPQFA